MKRIALYFNLLLFFFISISSNAQKRIVGKSYVQEYYQMGQWWSDWDSIHYSYSIDNIDIIESNKPEVMMPGTGIMKQVEDYQFKNHYKPVYSGDTLITEWDERIFNNGRLVEDRFCRSNTDVCGYRRLYKYNSEGFISNRTSEKWDKQTESWIKYAELYKSYNSINNVVEEINEGFHNGNLTQVTVDSFLYQKGKLSGKKQFRGDTKDELLLITHTQTYYDIDKIDSTYQYYLSNNEMLLSQKNILFYSGNRIDSIHRYARSLGSSELNSIPYRYLYNYNDSENIEHIDIIYAQPEYWVKYDFQYGQEDFISSYNYYNKNGDEADEFGVIKYYYGDAVLNSLQTSNKSFQISPNPVRSVINLGISDSIDQLTIFNVAGQLMYECNNKSSSTLDVSFLLEGVYIVQIISNNHLYSSQFVKQ